MEIKWGVVGLLYLLPNTLFCTDHCFFCKIAHLTYVAIGEASEISMKCKCDVIFLQRVKYEQVSSDVSSVLIC